MKYPQHEIDPDYYQEMIGRFNRVEKAGYDISDHAALTAVGSFIVSRQDMTQLRLALGEPVLTRQQRAEYERRLRRHVTSPREKRRMSGGNR